MYQTNAFTNKYNVQNKTVGNENIATLSISLCERGMKAVSGAIDGEKLGRKSMWAIEISMSIVVIESLISILDKENPIFKSVLDLYMNMGSIAKALLEKRIPAEKASKLLSLFTEVRNQWSDLGMKHSMQTAVDISSGDVL
ncbi:MAG: hypothetical protein RLZZ59_182 [Pseudomonadota bacterium]|jgi:flagellin-specific chaperone FliS